MTVCHYKWRLTWCYNSITYFTVEIVDDTRHFTTHFSQKQILASRFLPQLGGPCWNIGIRFGVEKLEWWFYQVVKKFENMFALYTRT